jgi:DNA replication protein DnaC
MNAAQLERLQEQCSRLRLVKSRERLEALLQEASSQEIPYADFLDRLLTEEVAAKTAKNITMRTSLARFPFVKAWRSSSSVISPRSTRSRLSSSPPVTSSSMARMSLS